MLAKPAEWCPEHPAGGTFPSTLEFGTSSVLESPCASWTLEWSEDSHLLGSCATLENPNRIRSTALKQCYPFSDQEVLHSVCREHLCIPGGHFSSFIYKRQSIFILFMLRTRLCCQASGQGPLKSGTTEVPPLCVLQTHIPEQMADADLNYKLRFIWNPIKGWGRQEGDMGFFSVLVFFLCLKTQEVCVRIWMKTNVKSFIIFIENIWVLHC